MATLALATELRDLLAAGRARVQRGEMAPEEFLIYRSLVMDELQLQ